MDGSVAQRGGNLEILVARDVHAPLAASISAAIRREVRKGAVGMALRSPRLIRAKMASGEALIALDGDRWVGFCYISTWEGGKFLSTSALIVRPSHRLQGIARRLKAAALELAGRLYPEARPFGLSTSEALGRINAALGFRPVPYAEITCDPEFWEGCETCPFHGDLERSGGRACRCRAMLR